MFLNVTLNITPTIEAKQWDEIWLQTLEILKKFPVGLTRISSESSQYGDRKVIDENIVSSDGYGEYWEFDGDADSLSRAGAFRLYRNIEYYRAQWKTPKAIGAERDPLFCNSVSISKAKKGRIPLGGVTIFDVATQGFPYQLAAFAVMMFLESRLPERAFGWGHLPPKGCEFTREWLESQIHQEILPLFALSASRLWNRLEGTCGEISTVAKRFMERCLGSPMQKMCRLLAENKTAAMKYFAAELLDSDTLAEAPVAVLDAFLNATNSLDEFLNLIQLRNELACQRQRKPKLFQLEDVVAILFAHFVPITYQEGEDLRQMRHWLNMEGNIAFTQNTNAVKAVMPQFFDFHCSEEKIIEAIIKREPDKKDLLVDLCKVARRDMIERKKLIEKAVDDFRRAADAHHAELDKDIGMNTRYGFGALQDLITYESYISSNVKSKVTKKHAKKLGFYVSKIQPEIQKLASGQEASSVFSDATGEKQRKALTLISSQRGLKLTSSAWKFIDKTKKIRLLNYLICVATLIFDERFEDTRKELTHVLCKPKFWKSFMKGSKKGK